MFPKLTIGNQQTLLSFVFFLHKSLNEYGTKYLKGIKTIL